ncbi:MAG: hypothetical protein ACOC6C_05015, partial [Verrucomicrobiota bacterium]
DLQEDSAEPEKVHFYTFDGSLHPVGRGRALSEDRPEGDSTDIIASGREVIDRYGATSRDIGAIILISDGRQVDGASHEELSIRCRGREAPVYVIPLGGEVPERDLSIEFRRKQHVAFAGQPVTISARIRNQGLNSVKVRVSLTSRGEEKDTRELVIDGDTEAPVSFSPVAGDPGYHRYRLKINKAPGEKDFSNNETEAGVFVLGRKIRVYFAEGVPHWDSKFLIQLLRNQPHVDVTSVYRLASERFFKVETDKTRVSESTMPVFPDNFEELASYDIVVFGKGAEYFLTPARIDLLKRFVREQGGGLLFSRSKPYSGSFPELEHLEPVSWAQAIGGKFRVLPARAGENAGLFEGMLPGRSAGIWQSIGLLDQARACRDVKPFAEVLAAGALEGAGRKHEFPAIIARRYGKGMVVTVNFEGSWRWDFFPSSRETGEMYGKLWVQLLQWIGTYAEFLPGHEYSLKLKTASVYPGESVRLQLVRRAVIAREQDEAAGASGVPGGGGKGPGAEAGIRMVGPEGESQTVIARDTSGRRRRWEAILSTSGPGAYRFVFEEPSGGEDSRLYATLHVRPLPGEEDVLSADHDFLAALAEASGGAMIGPKDAGRILRETEPEVKVTEMTKAQWVPYWDRWWMLCLTLCFFGAEWFVRRRNGLM